MVFAASEIRIKIDYFRETELLQSAKHCYAGHRDWKLPTEFSLGLDVAAINTATRLETTATRDNARRAPDVSGEGLLVCAGRFGSVTAPVRGFKSRDYARAFAACTSYIQRRSIK